MSLLDLVGTVAFLTSILVLLIMVGCIAVFAIRGQWGRLHRAVQLAGIYVGCYALVLIAELY